MGYFGLDFILVTKDGVINSCGENSEFTNNCKEAPDWLSTPVKLLSSNLLTLKVVLWLNIITNCTF